MILSYLRLAEVESKVKILLSKDKISGLEKSFSIFAMRLFYLFIQTICYCKGEILSEIVSCQIKLFQTEDDVEKREKPTKILVAMRTS